jgi:hypothetical protein
MACHSSKLEIHNSNICSFTIKSLVAVLAFSDPCLSDSSTTCAGHPKSVLRCLSAEEGSPRDPACPRPASSVRPCDLPHRAVVSCTTLFSRPSCSTKQLRCDRTGQRVDQSLAAVVGNCLCLRSRSVRCGSRRARMQC